MFKVIYLACGRARLNYPNVVYNDIVEKADLSCDMMDVDLSDYDVLIATPPCNYYSRANNRRDISSYALNTKHLLPDIIDKFISTGKPFIVENVRNYPLFKKLGLYDKNCFIYTLGRHTYWTNLFFNISNIPQTYDFMRIPGYGTIRLKNYVQGGDNVNNVFNYFIDCLKFRKEFLCNI